MDVSKKLGRFKQWAGEKMGGEAKTDTSEEFKALEAEMDLRYEGALTCSAESRDERLIADNE
jgi:hypothetical protein